MPDEKSLLRITALLIDPVHWRQEVRRAFTTSSTLDQSDASSSDQKVCVGGTRGYYV